MKRIFRRALVAASSHTYGATITFNAQNFTAGRLNVAAIKVVSGPETLYLGTTSCAPHELG